MWGQPSLTRWGQRALIILELVKSDPLIWGLKNTRKIFGCSVNRLTHRVWGGLESPPKDHAKESSTVPPGR